MKNWLNWLNLVFFVVSYAILMLQLDNYLGIVYPSPWVILIHTFLSSAFGGLIVALWVMPQVIRKIRPIKASYHVFVIKEHEMDRDMVTEPESPTEDEHE